MAKRPEAPCRGCETRQPGCHGKCEKYKTWKTADDEWRRINNRGDQTGYFVDRHYKIDRNFRRKHQK